MAKTRGYMGKKMTHGVPSLSSGDLWQAADVLRSKMDTTECKQAVLSLSSIEYIPDVFEEEQQRLESTA